MTGRQTEVLVLVVVFVVVKGWDGGDGQAVVVVEVLVVVSVEGVVAGSGWEGS